MNRIRVLLVDDEEELVATIQERLEMRGILAEAVTTGHDALERIQQAPFDVVVVDLKMPGLDGTETVEVIRERRPEIQVLLITGHGSGHGELGELADRGYRILLKPFQIDRLIAMIREAATKGEAAE
jgi:two-component system OmpR family response regulator